MTTPTSILSDKLVDMAFITQLTGLTDKWFYKLIQDGYSLSLSNSDEAPAGYKAKWKPGYCNALQSHGAEHARRRNITAGHGRHRYAGFVCSAIDNTAGSACVRSATVWSKL